MNFQSEQHGKYILRLAKSSDNNGIRSIFESGSFAGGMNIRFLRGAQPLSSFEADGDRAHILVAEDTRENRLIAVGGAVVRTEYLSSVPKKCSRRIRFYPCVRHRPGEESFLYSEPRYNSRSACMAA